MEVVGTSLRTWKEGSTAKDSVQPRRIKVEFKVMERRRCLVRDKVG